MQKKDALNRDAQAVGISVEELGATLGSGNRRRAGRRGLVAHHQMLQSNHHRRHPKVNFKYPYLLAMREQAPKMFNQLRRTGALDAYVDQKSKEAQELLDYLTKDAPKLDNGLPEQPYLGRAESQVFETLIEFQSEKPEPGDPLGGANR